MARTAASARTLTDHDEIRRWAEERGASPACVRGTGGGEDVGMIRLDFPGYSGEQSLEDIDWDDWFEKFDESNLALLVQDQTARGQKSNFNKLVSRETAETTQQRGRRSTAGGRSRSRRARTSAAHGRTRRTTRSQSATKSSRSRSSARASSGRRSSTSSARGRSARTAGSTGARSKRGSRKGSRSAKVVIVECAPGSQESKSRASNHRKRPSHKRAA